MASLKKEQLTLNDKAKFDDKDGSILGVLEGPVADFINPTRNGRHYSEELWDKVMQNPIVQEQFANGGIVGELDHPADREDICSEKIAVIMPEPPVKKNGEYVGKFNILNTPCGKIVYTLAKAGFKLGVSSRGTGEVDDYTNEVDPDAYEFTCFDVVLLPAIKEARMNLVTESLNTNNTKSYNYKKVLKEELEKSSERGKEIMKETLEHLGIDLNEDKQEKCVICGKPISGYGNNPYPVKKDGRCCDECNWKVVIPARLKNLKEELETAKAEGKSKEEIKKIEAAIEDADKDYEYCEDHNNPWGADAALERLKSLQEALDNLSQEETIAEPVEDEEVKTEEDTEEEVYCTATDEQILKLLDKFLDGEGLTLDGEGEEKEHFIELFKEIIPNTCQEDEEEKTTVKIDSESEEDAEKEEDKAVGDTEVEDSEFLEQFTKVLKDNSILNESVQQLQAEKAVSSAKVEKLNEEINKLKNIVATTGKKIIECRNLEAQKQELQNNVKSLQEDVAHCNARIEAQSLKIKELTESKIKAENEVKSTIKLTEELKSNTENSDKKVQQLSEQLKSTKKIAEQYKQLAHNIANKYIESKALSLGISSNEIKNRLNESYSLEDVDKVCEELQNYSLNISSLPFNLDKPGKLNMRIRENKEKDPLKNIDSQYDDSVDDFLLDLAGLSNK